MTNWGPKVSLVLFWPYFFLFKQKLATFPLCRKKSGKIVLSPLIFQCRSCWYCWAKVQTAGLPVLQCTEVQSFCTPCLKSKISRCCQKLLTIHILKITRNWSEDFAVVCNDKSLNICNKIWQSLIQNSVRQKN